jgi:hypothetical protein
VARRCARRSPTAAPADATRPGHRKTVPGLEGAPPRLGGGSVGAVHGISWTAVRGPGESRTRVSPRQTVRRYVRRSREALGNGPAPTPAREPFHTTCTWQAGPWSTRSLCSLVMSARPSYEALEADRRSCSESQVVVGLYGFPQVVTEVCGLLRHAPGPSRSEMVETRSGPCASTVPILVPGATVSAPTPGSCQAPNVAAARRAPVTVTRRATAHAVERSRRAATVPV